ncbi:gastrula zinc finger protein xFG20-1 [Musca domestica]|uniref:Gastrula zinc finger protein xFG20-1 n=1 Tax=Musca domestica TaxID=7370 RepID=A0A9J7CV91_MUSDO|nr:gastrula zinc finger protein xFG20-1 [Musca domestica]
MAGFVIKGEIPDSADVGPWTKSPVQQENKQQLRNYRLRQDNTQQQQQSSSFSAAKPMKDISSNGGLLKLALENGKRQETKGNHCGEIFVTNNAKKWTFVCTYCQKSTRDIGEFVCHIKFKHMGGIHHSDEDDDDDAADENNATRKAHNSMAEDSYNQGQDYFDCTNYLDVNVHIEDSDEQQSSSSRSRKTPNSKTNRNGADVVNLLDEEEEEEEQEEEENKYDNNKTSAQYEYESVEDDEQAILIEDADQQNENPQHMDEDTNKEFLLQAMGNDNDSLIDDIASMVKGNKKRNRPHVKGSFSCKLCEKTFQYFSLYRNHMIKHSNFTPFKCEFCDKGFKSKQAIRYHMKTHSTEKEFQCPLCPSNFATSSVFISHVMTHESATCFPCMVCGKILSSEHEREEHVETHSEERPYSCSFCSKRFRQKHHLSNHLKLHCRYRCDFCKVSFNSTQTQRRPYACPSCEDIPEIRQQVERRRALLFRPSTDVLPMEFENVVLDNVNSSTATECVDLDAVPSDDNDGDGDDQSEDEGSTSKKIYPQCTYCFKAFAHVEALNFHIKKVHNR